MEPIKGIESCQYEISESDDGGIVIYIRGRMDSSNASRMIEIFGSLIKDRQPSSLTVDLKKVSYLDDFGALVLVELRDMIIGATGHFDLKNAKEDVLFLINSETTAETFDFYFLQDTPTAQQWEAIEYIDQVLQKEDIDIVESVQRGMNTPAYEQGRFVCDPDGSGLSEHAVHHFHSLYLRAIDQLLRERGETEAQGHHGTFP